MINIITNTKKNTFTTKGKPHKAPNMFSFKANSEITHWLRNKIYDKSKFIKKALHFYILMLTNPKKIMMELKRQNPEIWKYVNRRKFYPGGKFT